MTTDFNLIFYIKMTIAFIMTFAFGMKFDVSDHTRKIAGYIWMIAMIGIWILNSIFPTK